MVFTAPLAFYSAALWVERSQSMESMKPVNKRARLGVVLGGGGARGAYEVGILSGVQDILGRHGLPFTCDVFVGSSIGALNAAWLAAHAQERDMGAESLVQEWLSLRLEDSVRLHTNSFRRARGSVAEHAFSLLDPSAMEALTEKRIPWTQLHYNLASGTVQALVVTALNIATGQSTAFAQLSPDASYRASRDPRRTAKLVRMGAEHVLASSAFPLLFPARKVEGKIYCDGGLRQNTPIAPALRAGSDKLLVISLLAKKPRLKVPAAPPTLIEEARMQAFPSPIYLMGKLLTALLLNPLEYDLQVLDRFNRLVEVLEEELDLEEMVRVREVLTKSRGVPYRRVPTLVFEPTRDIGAMAGRFLERRKAQSLTSYSLKRLNRLSRTWEADFMSFILFDGEFARELIELGRHDAREREAEVVAFFR